jgi:1A family penicillin-binding protein
MPERKYYRKIYQKEEKGGFFLKKSFWQKILWIFLAIFFLSLFLFVYYIKDLPRPEDFLERPFIQSTKIYDRTGENLLYEIYGEEKRKVVSLKEVPEYLKEAVIVTEDKDFYRHIGVDLKGIFRSVLINLKIMKAAYGGSTIPQQLIRSSFLTRQKTIERKIREIVLAIELDRRYPKDQILEWYLNQIPFGSNAYGVEAASQTFFNKLVSEISLPEAAVLAALIQSPSSLSPYGENKEKLLSRKDYVLEQMAKEKYITQEELEKAKKEELVFVRNLQPIKAPHFVLYVKDYLEKKYGEDFLKEKGLKVYTTLDWDLQGFAEKAVEDRAKINEKYNAFNAALVTIDPETGEILAMVGSKNYFADPYPKDCAPGKDCLFDPEFNVAIQGLRQPGSAFKPFVYATAFKKGFDDKTIVIDEETNFGVWGGDPFTPRNYDGKFRGPVTLREALAQSLNVPSVKVLNSMAGLEDSIKTAQDMGITTLDKPPSFYGLALVLGGGEVKLLDMTSAYGVFATNGFKIAPSFILKIEDSEGNIIEENKKTKVRILESKITDLINSILSDNEARAPIFGSRSYMYFENYQVAAKTGTTQNTKDGWIIGYTPSLVTGVWVGNNNNTPMQLVGATSAGPIWRAFMDKALLKFPKENFSEEVNNSNNLTE